MKAILLKQRFPFGGATLQLTLKKYYTDKYFNINYDTDAFVEYMSICFIQTMAAFIMTQNLIILTM